MPRDDHRPFRLVDELGRLAHVLQRLVRQLGIRNPRRFRVLELGLLQLHVPGHVDQHRPRPSFLGHPESIPHRPRQVVGRHHQIRPLRAHRRDAANIALLERLGAHGGPRHLAGDSHQRHAVRLGSHDPGDQVGRTGTRGRYAYSRLARHPGVAVRRVRRRLFVPHQHVPQLRVRPQRVVERQDRSAGVAEQRVDPFPQQALADDFRTFQFHGLSPHKVVPSARSRRQHAQDDVRRGTKKARPIGTDNCPRYHPICPPLPATGRVGPLWQDTIMSRRF